MSETTVRVVVPVDVITALRAAEVGYSIGHPNNRTYAELTLECQPADELALLASDHADPGSSTFNLELDLSKGLRRLVDNSPPIPADVPGPSRSPMWSKPKITQQFVEPVHLQSSQDPSDLPAVVSEWIRKAGSADPVVLDELLVRWDAQAQRLLAHATEVASALPPTTADEKQGVLKRLEVLARQVRYCQDGGLDPFETDYVHDEFDDDVPKPAHWYVNEAYNAVLDACDKISSTGGDRVRTDDIQRELRAVLSRLEAEEVPERFKVATELGLLDTMIGAARDELLGRVWPEWHYPAEDQSLREVSNPQLSALERLRDERAVDKRKRRWEHDTITLKWLEPDKHAVLATSFLGRQIIHDLPDPKPSGS